MVWICSAKHSWLSWCRTQHTTFADQPRSLHRNSTPSRQLHPLLRGKVQSSMWRWWVQMEIFGMNPQRVVEGYSEEFEEAFMEHLKRAHPHARVLAKNVYNEFITDKHHVHMNSTKWLTLTEFVKYLGREGKCKVRGPLQGRQGKGATWQHTEEAHAQAAGCFACCCALMQP